MTDWSVILIKDCRKITLMSQEDNKSITTKIEITTEEQIKINVEYLSWLYRKSRERKKQNQGLLDTRRAIELVIRDAGGERALKELFLKEQDEKVIYRLSKINPMITEAFKHDRETGLQTLNGLLANMICI